MKFLYLILDIGSISIPLIYSFHPKLKLYRQWPVIFFSIILTMFIFIPWDIVFTEKAIWGFNENYLLGLDIFNLPIEEWLFFICIPFACIFTHYALLYYFPNTKLNSKTASLITIILIIALSITSLSNLNKWYTAINFGLAAIILTTVQVISPNLLRRFYLTFLVILIPFFLVNGTLTGGLFIENEIVWYDDNHNLGFRLLSIPIEDSMYALSLILLNLFLIELFQKKASLSSKAHPKVP